MCGPQAPRSRAPEKHPDPLNQTLGWGPQTCWPAILTRLCSSQALLVTQAKWLWLQQITGGNGQFHIHKKTNCSLRTHLRRSLGAHKVRKGPVLLHSDLYTQAGRTQRNMGHLGDLPKAPGRTGERAGIHTSVWETPLCDSSGASVTPYIKHGVTVGGLALPPPL